jgi:cytochrome c
MKKALIAAALAAATATPALASLELATKNACTACHDVDKKKLGPGYNEVAAKYKGNAKAPAILEEKIKKGSVGAWGQVPMPPNPNVKDEDVKSLAKWILTLK